MFYNSSIISDSSLKLVYKLLSSASRKQESATEEHVRTIFKRQVALSKKTVDFDYRKLFDESDGGNRLEQYFDVELLKFVDAITMSDWSIHTKKITDQHSSSRRLKCMMICAIMANNMDPRICFTQTLLGLACYAQGLRDKGIKLLNAFGVTCSPFHIRQHGSWWAKMRDAMKEINPHAWWRVTFDNLDFRMKFAKKISVGGNLRRMLHLLTSQVSFRKNSDHPFNNKTPLTKPTDLKTAHFEIEHDNKEWLNFAKSTFKIVFKDIKEDNLEPTQPIITKLEKHLSHWTSETHDKIVYTTIDEAHSGSVDDVSTFLLKLKRDLWIGKRGYPKYMLIGGDQQTYAHMKNLKLKYPDHYDWLYPVPGDWHLMKTAAEVLKHIMADGGFKIFASKCGHKGEINQWQDLHNILTACYEALFREAMEEFSKTDKEKKSEIFWEWMEKLRGENHNQVCRFWAQMLIYLHAYTGFYFAVRSGNWLLRNSCLKLLTIIFCLFKG